MVLSSASFTFFSDIFKIMTDDMGSSVNFLQRKTTEKKVGHLMLKLLHTELPSFSQSTANSVHYKCNRYITLSCYKSITFVWHLSTYIVIPIVSSTSDEYI